MFGEKCLPPCINIFLLFSSGTRRDACKTKTVCVFELLIWLKTRLGQNGKIGVVGYSFLLEEKFNLNKKNSLCTFALNLTLYTCCTCVKINFSSYQDLFLVTYPTGLNCRRSHSLLVPVAFPMVELGPTLFSLKKVLKSDKGPPAYNASGR